MENIVQGLVYNSSFISTVTAFMHLNGTFRVFYVLFWHSTGTALHFWIFAVCCIILYIILYIILESFGRILLFQRFFFLYTSLHLPGYRAWSDQLRVKFVTFLRIQTLESLFLMKNVKPYVYNIFCRSPGEPMKTSPSTTVILRLFRIQTQFPGPLPHGLRLPGQSLEPGRSYKYPSSEFFRWYNGLTF